ncbi:hypothetical protein JKF63_04947 [Porcisia hertigi]|uniref:Uncharacterized protein n=1 Tax=Porcisia hertigi TaxID=2761500 RepID=A0A836IHK5_9TRYP|nr:hypothetical protein JKF63_04947 [Porcisia hertigi]
MPLDSLRFEVPTVVAVFASHAVLCWQQPRTPHIKSFAEHLVWEYQVEYNCSCKARQQPHSITVHDTCVGLATPHEGETYYVRVVAKARLAGSTAGLVSTKITFTAVCNISTPWLSTTRPPVCIFDALYLCTNTTVEDIVALSAARTTTIENTASLDGRVTRYTLEGDVAVNAYRVVYNGIAAMPVGQARTVYYIVATARLHTVKRTPAIELLRMMQREEASLVFCGIADGGRLALRAALTFLSFLVTTCPAMCSSVFCITYGTPRLLLKEGPRLLAHTLSLSEQLLHFTQLPLSEHATPASDSVALSQRGSGGTVDTPPLGYSSGFYRNTLLGVQCRVEGGVGLHFCPSSPDQLLTEAEEAEVFDAAGQLRALSELFFPSSPHWMSPSVTSIICRTDGPLLRVSVKGVNLHYCPRVTLVPLGRAGTALFPNVTAHTPSQLECVTCFLPWVEQCAAGAGSAHAALSSISVGLLVQTSLGTAFASEATPVSLPGDLLELFRSAQQASIPWSVDAAPGLIECALKLLPLYALASMDMAASHTCTHSAVDNPLLESLCSLASAAEVILLPLHADATAMSSGGFLAVMSSIATRLSVGRTVQQQEEVPALRVPEVEAACLENALKEWKEAGITGAEVWTSRSAAWRQRLFRGLSLLNATSYRRTLLRMLHVFDSGANFDDGAPLACIEACLYAHTKYFLSIAQPSPVHMNQLLCSELSISSFYGAVSRIFETENSIASASKLPYLRESMLLWALCHCFELRREMARTTFCCNVGCAGCGVSTLSISISALLQREEIRSRSRDREWFRTVQCRVASSCLQTIYSAVETGVRCCVFLAAEAADFTSPEYVSMNIRTQESLVYADQHLFQVVTKADELLQSASNLRAELEDEASVAAVMSRIGAEVVGGCGAEEHRLVVALAPSTSRLVEVIGCTPVEGGQYAQRLRNYSETLLFHCLRLGVLRDDTDCTKAV